MDAAREAELLQALAREQAERRTLQGELQRLTQENELLRQKLDALARRLFGKKSEQLDPAQLQLLFQELVAPGPAVGKESGPQSWGSDSAAPASPASTPRPPRGPRLPEHLPVLEEVIEPEPVKACPEAWRRIGEEVTERLDYEPARFLRRRTVRPKYVRRAEVDGVPIVAALPACLQERSLATPGLLAHILVSKYVDHLPLYRQESIYWSRHSVWLPRQTMAQWVELAAFWLRPLARQIRQEVLSGGYVQIDETPVRYLAPGHGQTKLGYFWSCSRPGGDVSFQWETSRAAECLERIVPVDFRGVVQCDGYKAYQRFAAGRDRQVTLAGCLAHVRRKWYEAREQAPKLCAWVLGQFQLLYRIEAELRPTRAGPEERQREREKRSRPLMERLERVLRKLVRQRRILPRSSLGRALSYALECWPAVSVYLQDGRVEIDNNLVENSIRPTAVGKKNWLFIGAAEAGERSAILYTIVESCRRRGIDPFAYLRDVLERLPQSSNQQLQELTPAAWAEAQTAAAALPAAA